MSDPIRCGDLANAARFLAVDAIECAGSGHPGMCMGIADAATALFTQFLKFDPADPRWADRDRFVLSAGHGSALLYALLHLSGFRKMTLEQVRGFRKFGSRTAGHPEYDPDAGIETTTGPLGQGFANAVGMAIAERILNARFGDEFVDHFTYVIVGDGCLMEGVSYEAAALAGHLQLGKLIALWDDNGITVDGSTRLATSEDQHARFGAAGWDVDAVDGHDHQAIAAAIAKARTTDRPSLIACRTTIAIGAPTKAGSHSAHGGRLGPDEIDGARRALGWPYAPFEIPEKIRREWQKAGEAGRKLRQEWELRLAAVPEKTRREIASWYSPRPSAGWTRSLDRLIDEWRQEAPACGTVTASAAVLTALAADLPQLVGGAADVASLTGADLPGEAIGAEAFAGRNLRFGIREHAMAAVLNGLACHGGLVPFGATYLVFSDYLRPALRMSAMMGQRVVHVLADDSIAVGENGPTHQPVEQIPSLRAIPNLNVFRPADAIETAECWRLALENTAGPSAILLTKCALPLLPGSHRCRCGAYVVLEAPEGPDKRRVTLFASGSEVHIALEARTRLAAEGVAAAVVSVCCWNLFWQQDADYRETILGRGGIRIAIEAASRLGWERFVGEEGEIICLDGFGASGAAQDLFRHFGLTPENVIGAVNEKL